MTAPLDGIRVLEFTHAVMGPTCGLVLADLGADVIKIEPAPHGDHTRRLKGFGTGYFTFFNRNKRSLAVNLKTNEGLALALQLVESADVLVENFGPGTMDRLGLGYEAASERNPALIYCSLKGFMPGPYEDRLALDEIVQMMSGLAYMTGPPGQPLRAGASVTDIMGGTYGALGVLAALRERDATGRGSLVRNGLFETAAFLMGQHMAYAAIEDNGPIPPMPARVSAWAIYRTFATADGEMVFVGVTSDKQWAAFCEVFNRPDWLADDRLTTNNDRIAARDWLLPELEAMFAAMDKASILAKCADAGLPYAPINRPEDLFTDPHLTASDGLLDTTLPDGRQAALPRLPISLDGESLDLTMQPPDPGAHSRAIMQDCGFTDDTIHDYLARAIIAEPPTKDSE